MGAETTETKVKEDVKPTHARCVPLEIGGVTLYVGPRLRDFGAALAARMGQAVSTSELQGLVWPGMDIGSNVVAVYAGYLRKALPKNLVLRTRRGEGYVLEESSAVEFMKKLTGTEA